MRELPLAEKLRRLRGKQKQNHVAHAAGISPTTLCKLETAARGTTNSISKGETLRRLASHYGVLPIYLTGGPRDYLPAWAAGAYLNPETRSTGQRLRQLLRELDLRYGVTAQDLAGELLITPRDLEEYLSDRLPTSPPILQRIEALTGIPADWILNGTSAPRWAPADYEKPIALAIAAGLPPEILEELIRAWIARRDT